MAVFRNALRDLQTNPDSYTGSPGFKFALNTGLDAVARRAPGGRGSGGALAALTKYGTGLAQQDYGNEYQRRLAAAGLEQEGEIAGASNVLARDRLALDDRLGTAGVDINRGELALRDRLGTAGVANDAGRLALDRTRSDRDYDIAGRGLDDSRERAWWDYSLGDRRQGLAESTAANDFTLGAAGAETNRYNALTNRGAAQSNDWWRRDEAARGWQGSGPARSRFEDRRPTWARGY